MQKEHRVGIVLDKDFGQRLISLAQRLHVWVINSPANASVIINFPQTNNSPQEDPLEFGITTFRSEGQINAEILAAIMEDVDEHHGEHAHTPPWTVLEIHGMFDNKKVQAILRNYGVTYTRQTDYGTEASRTIEV